MPNPTEADEFDLLSQAKPADLHELDGEPNGQQHNDAALDVRNNENDEQGQTKAPSKEANQETNPSAAIQEYAESQYAYALEKAKSDKSFLDNLVASSNPVDQKLARKLLERNDFGAKTPEEYRKTMKQPEKGADNPIQDIQAQLAEIKKANETNAWKEWKRENSVRGEAAKLADALREKYPDMSYEDVLDNVRGKLGATNSSPTKGSSFAGSNSAPPVSDEPDLNSPVAKRLLRGIDVKKLNEQWKQMAGR